MRICIRIKDTQKTQVDKRHSHHELWVQAHRGVKGGVKDHLWNVDSGWKEDGGITNTLKLEKDTEVEKWLRRLYLH